MIRSSDLRSTSRKSHLWRYVAVGVAAAIVTAPSILYDFVQDDHLLIVSNPTITSWRNLRHILTSDYFSRIGYEGKVGYYRPLTNLSFLLDHTLWGLSPTGFHLTNVVMSIITTLLAFRVALLLLPGRYAMLAGLFFAFHPGRVQAVGMITARSDLFAALFGFWAAGVWLTAREGRRRWWWIGILLFCALLGKESSIAVVAVLGLWSLAQAKGSPGRGRVSMWFALGFPVAAYLLVRAVFGISSPLLAHGSLPTLLAAGGRAMGYYLWSLILPLDTATAPLLPFPSPLWGFMLLGFIPLLLPLLVWKDRRAIAVGISWSVMCVAPLLLPQAIRNPTIEGYLAPSPRFLYVPALGVAVLWAGGLQELGRRPGMRRAAMLLGVLWAVLLADEFLPRLEAVRNDGAITKAVLHDLQKMPERARNGELQSSLLAHKALVLSREERLEEAALSLEEAVALDPNVLGPRINLAWLWHRCGHDSLAIALLQESLDSTALARWAFDDYVRNYPAGVVLLATILREIDRCDEAGKWLRDLTERFPASWKAHMARARVQMQAGDSAGGLISLEKAMELAP